MTCYIQSLRNRCARFLAAISAILFAVAPAYCITYDSSKFELFLGFRQPTGSYEMVVNVGSVSNYLSLTPGQSITITNYSSTFLSKAFSDISKLDWSVLGTVVSEGNAAHPANTCWITRPRRNVNTQTVPWPRPSDDSLGTVGAQINAIAVNAVRYTDLPNTDPAMVTASAVILSLGHPLGYTVEVALGNLAGTWVGSVEGVTPSNFASSGGMVRCDLYECQPYTTDPNALSTYLGYFDFHSDGSMTFTAASGATAPAAPTGVKASATNGSVIIGWTPSTGATNYNVKRSLTSDGTFTTVGSVSGTNYSDTTVEGGTTYYYVVTAVGSGIKSSSSSPAVTATAIVIAPPAQPRLTATADKMISFSSETGVTYILLSTNSDGLTTPLTQWPQVGNSLLGTGNVVSFNVAGYTNAFFTVRASR